MKKIILANIGNRNLTYQKKNIPNPRHDQPGQSFRECTQEFLADYENIKADLNEQILSVLIAHLGMEAIEKVVLFSSDNQIEGDRNNQDTIYEAQLLQRLWAEQMNLRVEIVTFTRNVTHNDDLLRFYRDTLRPYQATDTPIVICDAGGTAQQKAALKIAAEYLLDPTRYLVRYVDSGKIIPVEQVEYRRIIDEEQVVALVEHGQYAGALAIYRKLYDSNPEVLALLHLLKNRADLFWANAQAYVSDELKMALPSLASFKGGKAIGNHTAFKSAISAKGFYGLCERLEVAHLRWQQGDWSRAVLGFSVFIEGLVNEIIQQQGRFMLVQQYPRASKALAESINVEGEHKDLLFYFGGEVVPGLPLMLKYAQKTTKNEVVKAILTEFEPLNSRTNGSEGKRGLDCLRNDLAHKGKSVEEEDLKNNAPTIGQTIEGTRQQMGFPTDNTYSTMSQLLINYLRK